MTTQTWRDDALCAQTSAEIFFPEVGHNSVSAKAVCALCDVRDACLDYALTYEAGVDYMRHGVWGGLTAGERERLAGQPPRLCRECGEPIPVGKPRQWQRIYCSRACTYLARKRRERERA